MVFFFIWGADRSRRWWCCGRSRLLKVCLKIVNVPQNRDRVIADACVQSASESHSDTAESVRRNCSPPPEVADKRVHATALVIVDSEHINTSVSFTFIHVLCNSAASSFIWGIVLTVPGMGWGKLRETSVWVVDHWYKIWTHGCPEQISGLLPIRWRC
jgi:hypothetical protein